VRTENRIQIDAPPDQIFRLAAEVEFWPALLPHYRYVRVLRRATDRRLVEMGASRDGIPVSWTSIQWLERERRRITFRHVKGVTRGMVVEWLIEPGVEGPVEVRIAHALRLRWPILGNWAADRVIGPYFVHDIAGKTLRRIKEIAEGGSLAATS
jgi:uncharacterized membrane protein